MTRQSCMGFEELHGLEKFQAVEALEGFVLHASRGALLFPVFLVLKGLVNGNVAFQVFLVFKGLVTFSALEDLIQGASFVVG